MIVHRDSLLSRIWMRLPTWLGSIEACRVGPHFTNFVRITLWSKS